MRKLVKPEDLINWWLKKYYHTNLTRIKKEHPEWEKNPEKHTREFYESYMVTQEQHDEWEKWAKEYTQKVTGIKGKLFDRSWWSVYMNTAPQINPKTEK